MRKKMQLLLVLAIIATQFNLIAKADETSNDEMFDSWHYRTEIENGKYSYGEDHPNAYELPEAYDARKEGIVTSVKNQGDFGICWAFGIIGAMESNILKKGLSDDPQIDLSEAHIGYFDSATKSSPMGLNPEDAIIPKNDYVFLDSGASALLSTLAFSKGVGPVYESRAPFYPYSSSFVDLIPRDSNFEREFYLKDAAFPSVSDTEGVKRLLLQSGAISMAYTASSSNYTDQYYVGYGLSNHIVTVVGYDDTIKKENFDLDLGVDVDGAWIVKNSWGETGNGGYFYLSYDASSLEIVAPNVVNKDVYDYNYFYDASDSFEEKYSYQGQPVVLANVYEGQNATSDEKEMLHSVGILMPGNNTNYELQIYMDPQDGNPQSGTPYFKQPIKGNKVFRGYYTICLPESIEIEKGQKFSVVFKLQNRNLNYETMYYLHDSYEGNYRTIIEQTMPNQSFRKLSEESGWEDLHDISRCVAIRALTSMKDQDYKPTKTLNPNDFSLNETQFTFTNDAIEPVVHIHNDELEEMMDYAIAYENNINLGSGKVIVYGMNDYEGSKVELPFTIHKAKLQQQFFVPIEFQLETGSQLKPQEKMYYYDLLLEEGKDYTVTYGENLKDNESDNEGSITLTGMGNFEGQVTMNFNIVNPKRMVSNTVSIEPANVGSASTASQARIGEEVRAVAGYYDYDYAFVGWYVDDILYGKDPYLTFIAKDNLHLVAKYTKKKTLQDLIQLVDDLDEFALEHLNDPKYATFIKEFDEAESILVNGEQDGVKITRAYIYLQKAYDQLEVKLDTNEANQVLKDIEQLNVNEYTFVSWGVMDLKKELVEKALNDYDMTQEKLDQAVSALTQAKNTLVKIDEDSNEVDKQKLIALYERKKELNKDEYTSDSYQLLQEQLVKVKMIIDKENASALEVEEAYQQLLSVELVKKADKTLLISLIEESQQVNKDHYTLNSYNLFVEKLNQAIEVKLDDDASQDEVNKAYYALQEAKQLLVLNEKVDKETLIKAIEEAEAIDQTLYTIESVARLKETINNAKAVNSSNDVTQDEVNEAVKLINDAIKALVDKPQTPSVNKEALKAAIDEAKAINTTSKTEDSIAVLASALTVAENVYANENATQSQVDEAKAALDEAMNQLEEVKPQIPFVDVEKSMWYYNVVKAAYEKGLMQATGQNPDLKYFEPDTPISRGMVATVLYRMDGLPKVEFKATFSDVTNSKLWYATAITWASQNNVVSGYKDGRFGPDDNITRQDLAIMLRNYAKAKGMNTNATIDFSAFKDGAKVDDYAESAIAWCVEAKLMSGSSKADGKYLQPKENASRAECAKMFSLLDDLIKR